MTSIAQTMLPAPQTPINLTERIPALEQGIPAEALEAGGISPWLLWGGIAAVCLVIGIIIFLIVRKKQKTQHIPTPEEIAMNRLAELQQAMPDLRACSLELSMTLREYLCGKTQDPAMFETHEEFSRRLDSLSAIPRECQYGTRMLLEKFAEMKYAGRQENAPQLVTSLIDETKNIILSIQAAQQKEAEAAKELEKVRKLS